MNLKQIIALTLILILGTLLTFWILKNPSPAMSSGDSHHGGHRHEDPHAETVRGPHGGHWLEDGAFQLEVTLFETGVPPEFRVYAYRDGEPVDPKEVELIMELRRLGGRIDTIRFHEAGEFLSGDQVIEEPHSFEVAVIARHDGMSHEWQYESFEGRTELPDETVRQSGIEIATAGPREITEFIRAYGRIAPNEDHLAYVIPRFPGAVEEIQKRLGETVQRDEVLARIRSSESLQSYDVRSPLAGTVIEKNVHTGEITQPGQSIYTVANLENVWVDLNIHPRDFPKLKLGQSVLIHAKGSPAPLTGEISYISPFGAENSQTLLARAVLPNPEGRLRPGLFVSANLIVEHTTVPLAVKAAALQTFRDWDVVFVRVGDIFEFRPVKIGRRDSEWVEVLEGLEPGQRYAAANSFVIKADILKSGAAHDH